MLFCSTNGEHAVEIVREILVGDSGRMDVPPCASVAMRMRCRLGDKNQVYEASMAIPRPDVDAFVRELGETASGLRQSTVLFSQCRQYGFWITASTSDDFEMDARFEGVNVKFSIRVGCLAAAIEEAKHW